MKVGRCGNGLAVARIADLYGIPRTQPRPPSRIPMRSVTRTSRIMRAEGWGVLDVSQGRASPTAIHCTPLNRLSLGASTCWTSSCSPSRSSSSRCRSATPSPAIGSEEAPMIFDYSLAGLVTVGLMIYLVYALLRPERLCKGGDHDRHRLDSNPALLRDRRRAGGAARRLHDARVQRRAHIPFAGPAAGRSGTVLARRRRRAARAALGHLHGVHAVLPRRRISDPLCADALTGGAAGQSRRAGGPGAGSLLPHPRGLHPPYPLP